MPEARYQVSTWLHHTLFDRVEEASKKHHISRAEIMRKALESYLETLLRCNKEAKP